MLKKMLVVASAFLSVLLVLGASARWRSAFAGPMLVAPAVLSLGNVETGSLLNVEVPIRNIGGKTLEITQIVPIPACNIEESGERLDAASVVRVEPGGQAKLNMSIRPLGVPCDRVDRLSFSTNDPGQPRFSVEVRFSTQGFLLARPNSITAYDLPAGSASERTIEIVDTGKAGRAPISRVVSDNPDVVSIVEWANEPVSAEDGVNARKTASIRLQLRPPGDLRRVQTNVSFYIGDATAPYGVIPVSIQAIPDLTISPSAIVFPRIVSGRETFECRCTVRRRDGAAFTLAVSDHPQGIAVELPGNDSSATEHALIVRVDPNMPVSGIVRLRATSGNKVQDGEVRVLFRKATTRSSP